MEMMAGMSRLADEYGLDVWIWYPAMDADYADPATVEFALKEWDEVFRRLPRIDAVFVPGGDPGHTRPKVLMDLLEKQAESLRRHHPNARMWVSPQSFDRQWLDEFLTILREQPAWLGGVVFGPQVRISLAELRAAVPAKYPIRGYPDITHSLQCQYPVPDWDLAFALTEGREVINPRPLGQASIFADVPRIHDRLPHLLRGLQRRCQQVRLERARLGPGHAGGRDPAPVRPLLHRRPPRRRRSRRGSWRSNGTGRGRS